MEETGKRGRMILKVEELFKIVESVRNGFPRSHKIHLLIDYINTGVESQDLFRDNDSPRETIGMD